MTSPWGFQSIELRGSLSTTAETCRQAVPPAQRAATGSMPGPTKGLRNVCLINAKKRNLHSLSSYLAPDSKLLAFSLSLHPRARSAPYLGELRGFSPGLGQ